MTARPQPVEQVPEEFQEMVDLAKANMGFVPNSFLIMMRRPALARVVMPMLRYLRSPEFSITSGLMFMTAYMASFGSGCRYCQAHTSNGAEHEGVSAEKVAQMWRYEESELFTLAERAALSFAFAAGQVPNAVEESHYAALREHYSEDQVLDLTAVVAIFGFLNRWNDTIGTSLEDRPAGFAAGTLAASGWELGKHR